MLFLWLRWIVRRAIALAVSQADTGDVVLIAGKGHETYQEVGKRPPTLL